jgi:hypothetical protein
MLRFITKVSKVTLIKILHEKTGMETVQSYPENVISKVSLVVTPT